MFSTIAASPGLLLRVALAAVFVVACGATFFSVIGGFLEDRSVRRLEPWTFRRGLVVFRSFVDLRELGDRMETPSLDEIITTRSARFRMINPEHGIFLARSLRLGAGTYRWFNPVLLRGTVRVHGPKLEAQGRLSPWMATFFGSYSTGLLVFAAMGATLGEPLFVAGPIGTGIVVTFLAGIAVRNAKQDAGDALTGVAAVLTGRSDIDRTYPNPT